MIYFNIIFRVEGDLIPGVRAEGLVLDLPSPETHLTPTVPREGGQSPDLGLPASRDQNHVLPEEDQGPDPLPGRGRDLAVQDIAVAANVDPGHDLPSHEGETACYTIIWDSDFLL